MWISFKLICIQIHIMSKYWIFCCVEYTYYAYYALHVQYVTIIHMTLFPKFFSTVLPRFVVHLPINSKGSARLCLSLWGPFQEGMPKRSKVIPLKVVMLMKFSYHHRWNHVMTLFALYKYRCESIDISALIPPTIRTILWSYSSRNSVRKNIPLKPQWIQYSFMLKLFLMCGVKIKQTWQLAIIFIILQCLCKWDLWLITVL